MISEINQKILDMILKNASCNEIASATGLSNKQLFHRLNMLKIKGYNFSRKYYYNGEITYKLNKGFPKEKEISLLTSPKDTQFKAVFLSDLHICNEKDRLDLLYKVYDFCIKEDINIIINAGDLIDGLLGVNSKKFNTVEEQIEYALKIHPYDKNILNFICLGNHEYDALEHTGQNLENVLLNRRHDIVPLGYGIGTLNIKNDKIIVRHPKTPTIQPIDPIINGLMIVGHTHKSQNIINGNLVSIYVSSLSDMKVNGEENYPFPSFVKATIDFTSGVFSKSLFEQYIFVDKMYKISESHYDLIKGKDTHQKCIRYEEERTPYKEEKVKILKNETRPSQIEKFNKRCSK